MGELDTQAYMISAFRDADAAVWVASSKDVPGLIDWPTSNDLSQFES